MTGTDGYGCRWEFHPAVKKEIEGLGPQGAGMLTAAVVLYGKGEALPRQVSHLGHGLSELRVNSGNVHFRLIFFHRVGAVAVGLVAFQKTTPRTPKAKVALARRRKSYCEPKN